MRAEGPIHNRASTPSINLLPHYCTTKVSATLLVMPAELDSSTMQSRKIPGLYFIGEVVDVTGWLGGYNFQWAWASGAAAGQSA